MKLFEIADDWEEIPFKDVDQRRFNRIELRIRGIQHEIDILGNQYTKIRELRFQNKTDSKLDHKLMDQQLNIRQKMHDKEELRDLRVQRVGLVQSL